MAKATRGRRKKAVAKKRSPTRKVARKTDASSKFASTVERMTVPELDALILAATARKDAHMAGARASFLDEVRAKAASLGMSLMDLVGQGASRVTGKKKSPAAKYRGPNGEEWSGRGRPARWLTQLETRGRKREEFLVKE